MDNYKHPLTVSKSIGFLSFLFLGMYGAHRFYLGQFKAGFLIMPLGIINLAALFFPFKFSEIILWITALVWLFEFITLYPRMSRYNESLINPDLN